MIQNLELKNMQDYDCLFSLAYDCPAGKRMVDCPFNEWENLSFLEKVDLIESFDSEQKDVIARHHFSCSPKRYQ